MQAPILTDTEAETTVELDESVLNHASQPTNATKSIFNITLNDGMYISILHIFTSISSFVLLSK